MNKIKQILQNRKVSTYVGILLVLILVIIGAILWLTKSTTNFVYQTENKEVSIYQGSFRAPSLVAESAIVWDIRGGKAIYQKNAQAPKPLASLTKIMTALIALERVPQNTTITIDSNSLEQEGESGLIAGEKWLLKDLIDFSLIESSNDGIAAVASAVGAISLGTPDNRGAGRVSFIEAMNQKARELNLQNMSFSNESGLDIYNETDAGAMGSAEDVARLFSYFLKEHPNLLEATTYSDLSLQSLNGNFHLAKNTNEALDRIPALIGSKTGYTDISGGNLAIIIDPGINYPIAIVVMGSTFEDRFPDMLRLSQATLNYFSSNN